MMPHKRLHRTRDTTALIIYTGLCGPLNRGVRRSVALIGYGLAKGIHAKSILLSLPLTFAVGLITSIATRASSSQSPEVDCPSVYISTCPDSCESDEKPCTFRVEVKGAKPDQKLTYTWEVSRGKIKTGQGTDTVTIDLSGFDRKDRIGITATVRVGGIGGGAVTGLHALQQCISTRPAPHNCLHPTRDMQPVIFYQWPQRAGDDGR